ncbi:MAG: DNA mismatch repair protein MutS [Lachnospiraceae bacterium]|nr:DNA mismatch repair protein MutS [Lachnospiraceae bacterium]
MSISEKNKAEQLLEFDRIKELWAEYALTDAAKEQIRQAKPILSEAELLVKQRETSQGKRMIELCGNPPLASVQGLADIVEIAGKGDCLGVEQLLQVQQALTMVSRLKRYLCQGKQYEISLSYYEGNLEALDELRENIYVQIVNEQVSDNASRLLKTLRGEITLAESRMREKADAVMRAYKECMSDSFSTFRNGRVCVPVKKEYKFKIAGSVIDKSSTGSTLFIEPTACADYYAKLQELRMEEENEVRRILYELTVQVYNNGEAIKENIRYIEKLDFIFSKGKLSFLYDGAEPEILTERRIVLTDARHPLMKKEVCVPLQFSIGDGINGIVITGPNTGGKTVALKTVALNCMLAQCGLHVACKEAKICMNSNFLCDIGDGQSLSENLSTFSAHITNVLDILRRVNNQSLVLMDELGSGTDPLEGMGIAVAILEELKKSGALFLVTTHYPEVKVYAEKTEGIVNARMTFDKENLKPLYRMVIGEAGESCAFHIAKRLGMPDFMLKRAAAAAYGEEKPGGQSEPVEQERICNRQSGKEDASAYETENGTGHVEEAEEAEKEFRKEFSPRIVKKKTPATKKARGREYQIGDSVMVYPDKKIGIVCQPENEKGVLQIQMPNKKIWINHKRVKLHVAAEQLYPEDYDFSILFDSVETRKLRHDMERKHMEGAELTLEGTEAERAEMLGKKNRQKKEM